MDKRGQELLDLYKNVLRIQRDAEHLSLQSVSESGIATNERFIQTKVDADSNLARVERLIAEHFKYPLQVFDLNKNEIPVVGTRNVAVYDEESQSWVLDVGLDTGNHFVKASHVYLPIDRFHRWTVLPVLEVE